MTQEALIKALEDEARAQAERIVAEAGEEARRVLGEAEREIEAEKAERLAALERDVAGRRTSLLNEARVRMAALKLRAKLGVIEEVMDRALKEIEGLPADRQAAVTRRLYREVRERWPTEKTEGAVVRVRPAYKDIVEEAGLRVEAVESMPLGVVMESADGRITFENTVTSRMEKARPVILVELNRLIFG